MSYNYISPRTCDCRFEVTEKTDESTVFDYVNKGMNFSIPFTYFVTDNKLHMLLSFLYIQIRLHIHSSNAVAYICKSCFLPPVLFVVAALS